MVSGCDTANAEGQLWHSQSVQCQRQLCWSHLDSDNGSHTVAPSNKPTKNESVTTYRAKVKRNGDGPLSCSADICVTSVSVFLIHLNDFCLVITSVYSM